jgi:hypothetical protein
MRTKSFGDVPLLIFISEGEPSIEFQRAPYVYYEVLANVN